MQIFGSNYCGEKIVNKCDEFTTTDEINYTDWLDTSNCDLYTLFIHNTGYKSAYVYAQVSPDGIAIVNDPYIAEIAAGETKAITAQTYGFCTRIAYKSLVLSEVTNLTIVFQAQLR